MDSTKLEKLLISEVSGVDDPANESPGWMVQKAQWTRAYINDLPDSAFLYIEPGGEKDEDGKTAPRDLRHFPYKDAGGAIDEPHLRNALSRIPQSDLPQDAKDAAQAKGEKLLAGLRKAAPGPVDAPSILEKVKSLILGKEDIDMTKEELAAELDARFARLGDQVAERLSKSVEPAKTEGAPDTESNPVTSVEPTVEAGAVSLTAEDVTKAIEEAFAPYNEILEKMLDRQENVEIALGIAARKSLDGQEGAAPAEGGPPKNPTVQDAITKALQKRA